MGRFSLDIVNCWGRARLGPSSTSMAKHKGNLTPSRVEALLKPFREANDAIYQCPDDLTCCDEIVTTRQPDRRWIALCMGTGCRAAGAMRWQGTA